MKRRDFLKLIGIAPFAPSVLKAAPKAKPISTKTNEFGWASGCDPQSYKPARAGGQPVKRKKSK